ncbi:Neuronal PAS domain-containing protein 4-like [Channa argus]|uniref:Neuronal PAS domain-containing protein 4-like n=1 Tax=Channa argus TaxID=215402 RepID=A0A6G1R147_CHAAH|nr:Neuronal PAS domain-containing protein 4-like [Channa argus]
MVSHRSTKGASKARRDHINHEIRNMRALLPITQEEQERLSYLHSMAAICTYIRKSVLFQGLTAGESSHCPLPYEAFLQTLHGFILVTTTHGRLVYVSENVNEYLGILMVDVLQGDTFYDMVEPSDVNIVKSNLDVESSSSSACSTTEPLFVALCTPTVNRLRSSDSHFCHNFNSIHRLDMTFTHLSDSVLYFLGYSVDEMMGRSWYSLVHPEDLSSSADSHRSLVKADEGLEVEMVLRLQCKDLSWTWSYIRAKKDSECQAISCTNYIISETEARFLQKKMNSDALRPSSSCQDTAQQAPQNNCYNNTKCLKRHRASNSQSEEPVARGDSSPVPFGHSPALFTPPYSQGSSSSPLHEEISHELLMDVHGYTDQLLSSPEGSPSYYSYPEAGLTCHHSPSDSIPVEAEQTFEQAAFGTLPARSPLSSSSPDDDFQACTSDARLVPDFLFVSDMCESPLDCALHQDDSSPLEQPQGGSIIQFHHVPLPALPIHSSLLTPSQSPTSTESNQYNEMEQAEISILAQQISSLANNFDMYHTLIPLKNASQPAATSTLHAACDWPCHPPIPSGLPLKHDHLLDDGVIGSIVKELDIVTRKISTSGSGFASYSYEQGLVCSRAGSYQQEQEHLPLPMETPEDSLPAEFTAMDPFGLQLEHHDQNTGLHQLNHFVQSSLQQGLYAVAEGQRCPPKGHMVARSQKILGFWEDNCGTKLQAPGLVVWPFSHSAITVGEQAVTDSFTGWNTAALALSKYFTHEHLGIGREQTHENLQDILLIMSSQSAESTLAFLPRLNFTAEAPLMSDKNSSYMKNCK